MSGSYGEKIEGDTRSNWLVFMFASKAHRNVFRKQSTMNAFLIALREATRWGYRFREVGFGGTHFNFEVDVPSRYSVDSAIGFLKSFTARRIFEAKPKFRLLYPRGSFWSGYEHHQSFGKDAEASRKYVRGQAAHHGIEIIADVQPVTITGWM